MVQGAGERIVTTSTCGVSRGKAYTSSQDILELLYIHRSLDLTRMNPFSTKLSCIVHHALIAGCVPLC